MKLAALLLVVLLLPGCAGAIVAAEIAGTAIGVYQRWEDRQAQIDQTAEIKKLREEIARLRLQQAPAE